MSNRGSNSTYRKSAFAVLLFCAAAIASSGQTFTTLLSFDGSNGSNPVSPLVQGFDGNLYGVTFYGGATDGGTVFKITTGGQLTTLHSFAGQPTEGAGPVGGLVQGTDGNFYGATNSGGGVRNPGTVFKITPGGTFTTLQ